MKLLSDKVLVLVIEKEKEPIAIITNDSIDLKDGLNLRTLYNNELAQKNLSKYLDKYKVT